MGRGQLVRRRPGLGTLVDEAQVIRAGLLKNRDPSIAGASALSAAELRLLPMLSTHLSFREMAEEMFLSRHTIKSEAMSLYRKLGAKDRETAIGRARSHGLLDRVGVEEDSPG